MMRYGRAYGYRVAAMARAVSDWILATGFWNDAGFWRDEQVWID